MNKLRIIYWILLFSISCVSNAQNSISVTNINPIYMDLTPSFNAGLQKSIITDDSQWLNYTTLVHPSDPTISITVEIAAGSIPEGLEMHIEASPYIGMSKGKQGTPTGKITVTHIPRVLIDNIGTSYTGSGTNEGHRISYSFIITDYSQLLSGATTVYVQYTITQ